MPETRLKCPSCQAVLKTTQVLPAGKSIKCPKCQGAIRIPGAAPAKPPQPAERPKPAPPPKKADPDDEDVEREEVEEEEEESRPAPKKTAPAARRQSPEESADDEEEAADDEEPADEEEEEEKPRKKKKKKDKKDRQKTSGNKNQLWLWLGIGGGAVAAIVVVLIIVLGGSEKDDKDGKNSGGGKQGGNSGGMAVPPEITLERTIKTDIRHGKALHFAASADSGVIVLGERRDGNVYLVDGKTGDNVSKFWVQTSYDPLISPDGKFVVINSGSKYIRMRDVKTGQPLSTIELDVPENTFDVSEYSLSPRGDVVYAAIWQRGIFGWNTTTRQVTYWEKEKQDSLVKVYSLSDGRTLLTTARPFQSKSAINVYNITKTGATKKIATNHTWIRNIASSVDAKILAELGNIEEKVLGCDVWSVETGQKLFTVDITFDPNEPAGVSFTPNGSLVALGMNEVASYDPTTGKRKGYWKHDRTIDGKKISHVFCCPNGEIAVVLEGSTITIHFVRLKE